MEMSRRLTGTLRALALILAACISVGIPAGYYLLGYQNQSAVVATEAYLNSILLSQSIGESPEYWRFEERRLAEILSHHSSRKYDELLRIITADNEVITQSGGEIAPPRLIISHNLYDSGHVVGRLEIVTSLRPLLMRTATTAVISLLLGLAVYLSLKIYPLHALSSAMQLVYEEKKRALSLLNNIGDIAWMKDREARYIAANEPFARLCGVDSAALPGKTDLDIWPMELAEKYRADDREILATGRSKQIEESIRDTAGGVRWVVTIKAPVFNSLGEVVGTTGVAHDFTERKKMEDETLQRGALVARLNNSLVALAGNENIYGGDLAVAFRAITEASALALATERASIWFYIEGNSAIECMDLYESSSGNHSAGARLAAADYPAYFRALHDESIIVVDSAVTDPRTQEFAESYLQPLGITAMLDVPIRVAGRVSGVACHEHVGFPRAWTVEEQNYITAIAGFTAMAIEICERKKAETRIIKMNEELEQRVAERTRQLLDTQEELVRKEKLAILGQLSGSVGHELRNPLGVMSNAVYFLKMVKADADDITKEYLDLIKKEIDNSLQIITDLLDFARTSPPQAKNISVRQLLDESIGKCTIPENVELHSHFPDTLPAVTVDPLQMRQVFQNLITNAVQAMPGGGSLRIGANSILKPQISELDGDFIEISVADTGQGISAQNMKNMFQPLFTTKAKGIGLGMVVCKNLVEANGGKITLESEPGTGTTVTVVLPVGG